MDIKLLEEQVEVNFGYAFLQDYAPLTVVFVDRSDNES
jgi:PKD repeat protein